jgi:tetratricopeptide (TPR) repeat protein
LNVDSHLLKAEKLINAGKYDEGGHLLHIALNLDPNNSNALWNLAYSYMKAEKWGLAYNLLKRARDLNPGEPRIWCNLAAATLSMASSAQDDKLLDEAESLLHKAIRKAGDRPQPLNHLALISVNRNEPERAIQFAERSLKLDPNQRDIKETLGYALLSMERWKEGFENYDYAINASKMRMLQPANGEPQWNGEKGGKLFIRGEQGIGDEISYASVVPDAAKDNEVTLECDKRLEGLFTRSFPNVTVHGTRFHEKRNWTGEFDYHCLSGSLCKEYRNEGFPRTPFLVADPERRVQWKALLDTLPGKKVGIAWGGGLPNTFSARRSFQLDRLLPLLQMPGISWVSLQYKDAAADIEAVKAKGVTIHHWERAVGKGVDYDETAALVSELDCVVSVCTAAVHLSGALGKKCFVLVPSKPRWWYGRTGRDHAWYESLELYRQTDKWPVERIQQRLKEYLAG